MLSGRFDGIGERLIPFPSAHSHSADGVGVATGRGFEFVVVDPAATPATYQPHRQHRRLGTLTVNVRLLAGDRSVRILERFVNRALLATLVVALGWSPPSSWPEPPARRWTHPASSDSVGPLMSGILRNLVEILGARP